MFAQILTLQEIKYLPIEYGIVLFVFLGFVYGLLKAWHRINVHRLDTCLICDSKMIRRIRRSRILKILPFSSVKYSCKSCKNKILVITFFKIIIIKKRRKKGYNKFTHLIQR